MATTVVGSFAKIDTTGTQKITFPAGQQFTPKALILWTSGSGAASGTWQASIFQALGFSAGPTNSFAVAGSAGDNNGTSDTARRMAAKVITFVSTAGALLYEADLASFDADGFTLNWTTNGPNPIVVNYLAIGGADVTGAKVVNWLTPTATGNHAVTGVGFSPDLVLHGTSFQGGALPVSAAEMVTGFGAMNAAGQQWANTVYSQDNAAAANTSRWQRTDSALLAVTSGESQSLRGAFASMDADGFTLNFATVSTIAQNVISLCLDGPVSKIGAFAKTTAAAPVSQAVTGVGFKPGSALFSTSSQPAGAPPGAHAVTTISATDGTNERSATQYDHDAADPTSADSMWSDTKMLQVVGSSPPVVFAEADLTSFDADGFTLNWTTNTTSDAEMLYLALGGNVAPNAPALVFPTGGTIIDRAITQRFDWDFSDPDAGDTQSKYDLQYRPTSTTTWTTVAGTTPNTFHDFAGGTFAAGDFEWQVRTYDAQGLVGPYSASGFFTAADAPGAPTITDPVNGGTIGASRYTTIWSAPSQDAYEARSVADNAGSADTATVHQTSGVVESKTGRSHSLTFPVNNRYEHIQVRIRVNSLWSAWASVRALVSYTPPATPSLTATPSNTAGTIAVAINAGNWPVTVSTVTFTGTGTGTITGPTATAGVTDSHSWTATLVTAAADGGTFDVAKDGTVVGQAVVGTEFTHEGLAFTINDGATDFALNDQFAWSTTATKTVSHDVRRREGSSGEGIRIATGVPVNGTFTDRTPASGVSYEYAAVATAENSTSSTSPWTA